MAMGTKKGNRIMKIYFILLSVLIGSGLANATIQTTANQDKPPRLYVKTYSTHDNGSVYRHYLTTAEWDTTFSGTINWSDGSAGSGTWTSHDVDDEPTGEITTWDNDVTWSWATNMWPNTFSTMVQTYQGSTNTYTNQPVPILWQHSDIDISTYNTYYNGYVKELATERRSAQAVIKLQTGVKATSRLRNLFKLTVSAGQTSPGDPNWASAIEDGYYYMYENTSGSGIPPQNINLGSYGALNPNGVKYLILPDNDDVDVTPSVAGVDYYSFNMAAPQKYLSYFDVFVQQANPGFSLYLTSYEYDEGHAFWRFRTTAPADALQYISPSLTTLLATPWGFYPTNNPDPTITNGFTVPGVLQNDGPPTAHSYNVIRTFCIGFPDLINGLEFTRGLSVAPPEWSVISYNCVSAVRSAGFAADIFALPEDSSPQNFAVTLIGMYPAPGMIIGPFLDTNDVFYSSAPY